MRKKIIAPILQQSEDSESTWMDLEQLVEVEITSENASHPIESALLPGGTAGWQAGSPGEQTIRLLFDSPRRLQRIFLDFPNNGAERTQEFVLRWSPDSGRSYEEIVRQQWNFNPENADGETEDYRVDLPGVTVLELKINPDISKEGVLASLARMRLA